MFKKLLSVYFGRKPAAFRCFDEKFLLFLWCAEQVFLLGGGGVSLVVICELAAVVSARFMPVRGKSADVGRL
jgi:hypothetical protein